MDNDNKALIAVVALLVIAAVSCVAISFVAYNARLRTAMENGYEEGSLPGQAATAWVKVKE